MRVRVVQRHDAGADFADDGPRLDERLAEAEVEAVGEIARQLDVLALIVADRHGVSLVQQDVRGHQHRIVEEAGADGLPLVSRFLI